MQTPPSPPQRRFSPAGLRRHFEGWPLGLGVVLAAALSAWLAVPRPVAPEVIPAPVIDREEQQETLEREAARAAAGRAGLPLEIRAVGEAFRQLGHAAFAGSEATEQYRARLRRLTEAALEKHGSDKLLELRAVQAELFEAALASAGAAQNRELEELGGVFYAAGLARHWFDAGPLAADWREVGTLFRVYWSETLGFGHRHPFAPTLNEWRVYYRFLLSRPVSSGPERSSDVQRKLSYVAALAQHDSDYAVHFARGVLLYQKGAFADAASEFSAHLVQHPDGPWSLRARNHLAACGAALQAL